MFRLNEMKENIIANIELEKKLTRLNCTVMMAHQTAEDAHALIAHTCGMMNPIKSKLQ